jgi:hypothetical protein
MRSAPALLLRRCRLPPQRSIVAVPRPSHFSTSLPATGGSDTHETLQQELERLAGYAQTSVSLKATLDTGLGLLLQHQSQQGVAADELTRPQRTLIQIATFLRRELPVRLARRVVELQGLPDGLHSMPSVQRVREWYEQSFIEIRRSTPPTDVESELAFCA